MHQFSAALLECAFGLLGVLFRVSRGRHARPTGFSAFRRRSKRVRRYAADPAPAVRSLPDRPPAPVRPRGLDRPREVFPADEIPLVRPYFVAHERSAARRSEAPRAAADEHELVRVQEQALARLRGWTTPNTSHPQMPTAAPTAPAAAPVPRIPQSRPAPPGDLLAPEPEFPTRPATGHRRLSSPIAPARGPGFQVGEGFDEPAAVTRRWLVQQERREVRV